MKKGKVTKIEKASIKGMLEAGIDDVDSIANQLDRSVEVTARAVEEVRDMISTEVEAVEDKPSNDVPEEPKQEGRKSHIQDLLINRSNSGHKGVVIMTQAASSRTDGRRGSNDPRTHNPNFGGLHTPFPDKK